MIYWSSLPPTQKKSKNFEIYISSIVYGQFFLSFTHKIFYKLPKLEENLNFVSFSCPDFFFFFFLVCTYFHGIIKSKELVNFSPNVLLQPFWFLTTNFFMAIVLKLNEEINFVLLPTIFRKWRLRNFFSPHVRVIAQSNTVIMFRTCYHMIP